MQSIRIDVPDSYDVIIGGGVLADVGAYLKNIGIKGKIAVVCDSNVAPLYLEKIEEALQAAGYDSVHFVFKAGEESKNITTLSEILEFFAENNLTRRDITIALGGGVTGDMTGFAAGIYMRGISYVQIPTTLLSAVDSSVGGKTAVDLNAGKNLAGVFIQPKTVVCDIDTLDTLSDKIYADGMAEVIKTAVLGDKELFEALEKNNPREIDEYIISRCVSYKGKIVSEDEFEVGVRKLLNLGHTPAHSIEKLSEYKISHGSAVAMGLAIIARACVVEKTLSVSDGERIVNLIKKYTLPISCDFTSSELANVARFDKKRHGNSISIIKIRAIGDCFIEKYNLEDIESFLKKGEIK